MKNDNDYDNVIKLIKDCYTILEKYAKERCDLENNLTKEIDLLNKIKNEKSINHDLILDLSIARKNFYATLLNFNKHDESLQKAIKKLKVFTDKYTNQ